MSTLYGVFSLVPVSRQRETRFSRSEEGNGMRPCLTASLKLEAFNQPNSPFQELR
jgi:hypothetical protein